MSDWPPPTDDSTRAWLARRASPRYSYCLRCGYPWNRVASHSTPCGPGRACFPLCEGCWTLLGHPEARISYYGALLDLWGSDGHMGPEEMAEVRRVLTESVAAGL